MGIITYTADMMLIRLVSDSWVYVRSDYAAGTLVIIVLYVVDMGVVGLWKFRVWLIIYTSQNIGTLDSIIKYLPDSYESSVTGPESEYWIEATNQELNGLIKAKTWAVGDLPINKKAMRLRWVFAKKSPTKSKAGIMQRVLCSISV